MRIEGSTTILIEGNIATAVGGRQVSTLNLRKADCKKSGLLGIKNITHNIYTRGETFQLP